MDQKKLLIEVPADSDFSIHNIPFGVFHLRGETSEQGRCCTALGNYVIDLAWLEYHGHLRGKLLDDRLFRVFNHCTLNKFMGLTKNHWIEARETIQRLFTEGSEIALLIKDGKASFMHPHKDVVMQLPARIGDYTDFYSSKNHAYNLGVMFRGKENALQPNWLWLPVGYHGRASSVVVSGTNIHRPRGQVLPAPDAKEPVFKASGKFDFELEMAHFIGGGGNHLGHPIDVNSADDKIFGLVLMNDWSARDIQNWEYVPLGPFLAKNLGTIISPWIVTLQALERFKVDLPPMERPVPQYLQDKHHTSYDIKLQVFLKTEKLEAEHLLATSNFKYMYWTMAQQVAHHTITGCNMQTGDLLGSGTISGTEPHEFGSLIELTQNGKEKIKLPNGEERAFLEDGDCIIMKGYAEKDGVRVGFGECRSALLAPIPEKTA